MERPIVRLNVPLIIGIVFAGAIGISLWVGGLFQQELINLGGVPQLGRFFAATLHPDLSPEVLKTTWDAALLTLAYAVCGTCFSLILGIVGGFLSSFFRWVRVLLVVPRSIHELIWGLLFVNLWGTDPLTAVLAIALPFGAITAKVFAEILDETPRQSFHALLHSGASPISSFFYSLLPQAFLNLLSYTFYRFECSIRSAAVLGIIGAGGLGYQILLSLQSLQYEQVWTFIYALLLLNGVVDFASARSRRQLGCANRLDINLPRSRKPISINPSQKQRKPKITFFLLILVGMSLLGFCFWYVNADFSLLWSAKTLQMFREIGSSAFPPDLSNPVQLVVLSAQTVAMSVLAIAIAGLGGMLLSFPAAYTIILPGGLLNPTKGGVGGLVSAWSVLLVTRLLLLLSRAVPAPVWALVVLFVCFPGILPGAIALGIHNLGILGRLKAEVVENLDERPLLALKAQGITASRVFFYGVLPLTLPRFLAYDLYRWEVCMRETAIVGIVGAGGLGYLMTEQLSGFDYQGLIVTLVCFLILTFLIDWLSGMTRRALR